MANLRLKLIGGGIFSLFNNGIQEILNSIPDIYSIENLYFEIDNERYEHKTKSNGLNPFDFVFDQSYDETYNTIHCPVHHFMFGDLKSFIDSETLHKINFICSKIKIKKNIIENINPEITENSIGMHIRLTDMHRIHPEYGIADNNLFINKLKEVLDTNTKNIFIACDNEVSLSLLQSSFKEVIFNNVKNRAKNDLDDQYINYQIDNMYEEFFWVDTFLDMLSLSKCGGLIYKPSGFSAAALFFSKTIKNIYNVI